MNQKELVNEVSNRTGDTRVSINRILESICGVIHDVTANGGDVVIQKLGKFSTTARSARSGRNPRTGGKLVIAAKTVPAFKARKEWRDAVK
jgi:DNA-binding protein HU-beta